MTYRSRRHNAASFGHLGPALSRRAALKIGGAGMLGLNMTHVLKQQAQAASGPPPKARSVIFLYQFGGPTHIDTFDLKPTAPEGIRGPFGSIATSVPGVRVCEHLPKTAKVLDKVCQIRSMHHEMKNHNSASYYALTGHAPPVDDIRLRDSLELFPAYGSMVDHLAPNQNEMPTFVAFPYVIRDGAVTPGQHASFLGKKHDPLLITQSPNSENFRLPELSLPQNLSIDRLHNRRAIQQLIDGRLSELEAAGPSSAISAYYDRALAMLSSERVRNAFDLSQEPDKVRDAYGRTTYGQSCLLARRLVEAGVKFINVYFAESIGGQSTTSGGWDTHGFNDTRMYPIIEKYHLPMTEQTLPTLLNDLDDRGLLDETLVVWMGEFGRTPKINPNVSRDHWPQCYTVLLAGGGVKRGYVYGASDRNASYPDRDGVRPEDLTATMFHLLGMDYKAEVYDAANRPLPIAPGRPIYDIFA